MHFLALAERAEPELASAEQETWSKRSDQEHGNLRAALTWLLDQRETENAVRLSGALWRFWDTRGYLSEGA